MKRSIAFSLWLGLTALVLFSAPSVQAQFPAQDPACLDPPDGTPDDAVCAVDGVKQDFVEIDTGIFVKGGNGDFDNNGIIDVFDFLRVLDHLGGTSRLSNEDYAVADINGDGRVSWDDAGILVRLFVGVPKA